MTLGNISCVKLLLGKNRPFTPLTSLHFKKNRGTGTGAGAGAGTSVSSACKKRLNRETQGVDGLFLGKFAQADAEAEAEAEGSRGSSEEQMQTPFLSSDEYAQTLAAKVQARGSRGRSGQIATVDGEAETGVGVSSQAAGVKNWKADTRSSCDCDIDMNLQNKEGNTALIWACWYGRAKCVRALLSAGANPDARSSTGSERHTIILILPHTT